MRLGIVVVVRAPGTVVGRLELRRLNVRRAGRFRALELVVANRGNVTEVLERDRLRLSLLRRGHVLAILRTGARELLPRTMGIVQFRYAGDARGRLIARVVVRSEAGTVGVQRTFRIRL